MFRIGYCYLKLFCFYSLHDTHTVSNEMTTLELLRGTNIYLSKCNEDQNALIRYRQNAPIAANYPFIATRNHWTSSRDDDSRTVETSLSLIDSLSLEFIETLWRDTNGYVSGYIKWYKLLMPYQNPLFFSEHSKVWGGHNSAFFLSLFLFSSFPEIGSMFSH